MSILWAWKSYRKRLLAEDKKVLVVRQFGAPDQGLPFRRIETYLGRN